VLHGAGLLMQTATELLSSNIKWQAERKEEFFKALEAHQ
jgi:hypothetical protein